MSRHAPDAVARELDGEASGRLRPLLRLAALGLAACVSACVSYGSGPDAAIVRDLSDVAGCRFIGTLRPPVVRPGLREPSAYDAYIDELKRRTVAAGGTHLYLLNEAAGWGAATAIGTIYRCR